MHGKARPADDTGSRLLLEVVVGSEDVAVRLVIPSSAVQQPPAAPVPADPGTSPGPGSTPGTKVPVAGPPPAPFDLPLTGIELLSVLLVAVVLLVLGAALVRSGRTS